MCVCVCVCESVRKLVVIEAIIMLNYMFSYFNHSHVNALEYTGIHCNSDHNNAACYKH